MRGIIGKDWYIIYNMRYATLCAMQKNNMCSACAVNKDFKIRRYNI